MTQRLRDLTRTGRLVSALCGLLMLQPAVAQPTGSPVVTNFLMESMVKEASAAQDSVEKIRAKVADLYNVADTATKRALLLGKDKVNVDEVLQAAHKAQARAAAAKAAVHRAQDAANDLVKHALALKRCLNAKVLCDLAASIEYPAAVKAHARVEAQIAQAEEETKLLRETALRAEATEASATEKEIKEFIHFRSLLQRYPDARSLLGKDSASLSADGKGTNASIQLGLDVPEAAGVRRYTVILSTPIADSGPTKLYDTADGLAGTTQLTFAMNLVRGGLKLGNTLSTFSAGLTFGRDKRTYFTDGPAAPKEASKVVYPISLSLVAAAFGLGDEDTQVVRIASQRTYKNGPETVRCPVDGSVAFVDCVSGPIGEPQRKYSRVYTYQYRKQFTNFALAPALSYNDVSKVLDIDLPLYLIRSAGDGRPFNAGINFGWASKGKTAVTKREHGEGRVGVFIGVPFSTLDVGR